MKNRSTLLSRALIGTLAVALTMPVAIAAQAVGDGFLFQRPKFTIGIRGGFAMPRAGSKIFDFTRADQTVETSDYYGATLAGTLALRVTERLDISAEVGFAGTETLSESREYIGSDDLPILQSTKFTRIPATVSLKAYLWDRGRSIGRFTWVPRTWAPYVGGGAGYVWYTFEQEGEFVLESDDPDVDVREIFWDRLISDGGAGIFHFFAGADYSISERLLLTGEGRYSFASADLDRDAHDKFDKIDLAGFQATIGISVRF